MLNSLRAAYHFFAAGRAYKREQYSASLSHSTKFMRLDHKPMDYHVAFHATVLVLNLRSKEAEKLFAKVANGEVPPAYRAISTNYVRAYARYYLAAIRLDGEVMKDWAEAKCYPLNGLARRYLPLPETSVI